MPDAPPVRGEPRRGPRPGHAVIAAATLPEGAPAQPLPAAVASLFAARYATPTAAKKACRRGEVLVDGVQRGVTWCAPLPLPWCQHWPGVTWCAHRLWPQPG